MKGAATLASGHQADGRGDWPGPGPGWGFLMKATVSIPGASGPCKNMEATIRVLL